MTEDADKRFYAEGDAAYERGDLVTALRWWLKGIDEGDEESLTAALEVSQASDVGQDAPWNQLLGAIRSVHQSTDELEVDAIAPWSQFNLGPVDDLTLLSLPITLESGEITVSDDDDWLRVVDVLEESGVTFQPLGCSVVAGMWQAEDFGWSVPIMFGVDPPETPGRKLRIFSPLLIGLPAPEMAPNLEPNSPLPQAGFELPLRRMQILFARACLAVAETGIIGWMPMLRFGADLPDEFRPIPRISVGLSEWIMGPTAVHRLRFPLPQVSVGYDVDVSLSGSHLKSALSGAVDSVVTAVAKTSEACKQSSGILCEYITSIAIPFAQEQWPELFAEMVYPAELSQAAVWADMGLPSAMFDLGSVLAQTPGFRLDSYQWFDRAITKGYSPALASATWMLLCDSALDEVAAKWEVSHITCQESVRSADDETREDLARNLRYAESNMAIAAFLGSGDRRSLQIWSRLAGQGLAEAHVNLLIADLAPLSAPSITDYRERADRLARELSPGEWVSSAYITFADGLLRSSGPFADWCRRGLGILSQLSVAIRVFDDQAAHRARDIGRELSHSSDQDFAIPLQEAATRYGLPFAGADHSWRMLSQNRFQDAIALYDESEESIRAQLVRITAEFPELADTWAREWANYQSNVALCRIAIGQGDAWALEAWSAGAPTGNVESIFYPAVVALRAGDTDRASAIVQGMDGMKVAEMTSIALEGSQSSTSFWRDWSRDALRLLQQTDALGTSSPVGLSGLKSSSGLPSPGFGETAPSSISVPGESGAYRFCPSCGTPRVPEGRFCTSCGYAYG